MIDLDALCPDTPSRERPRAHRVLFERHRRDRFQASSVVVRWFPGDARSPEGYVGGDGRHVGAVQDRAYFEAFDAWWFEQDPDRPAAERFNEFLLLYESGALDG